MKKSILALILGLSLLAAGGCSVSGNTSSVVSQEPSAAEESKPAEASEEPGITNPTAADYYDYIQNVLVKEAEPAQLGELKGHMSYEGYYSTELKEQGAAGILSAVVNDFDGDGINDMLTFSIAALPMGDTHLGKFEYNSETTSLCVTTELYNIKNGEIQKSDEQVIAVVDGLSIGSIFVGMQSSEGTDYIFARSYMEDDSTYGSVPFEVYHVKGGKLIFDYMGGHIGWGQSENDADVNAVLKTEDMDISASGLNSALVTTGNLGMDEFNKELLEKLSDRALCYVSIDCAEYYEDIIYKATDYTGLRDVLSGSSEAEIYEPAEVEKEEEEELEGYRKNIKDILDELSAKVGEFSLVSEDDSNGRYQATYKTAAGSTILFSCDPATDKFVQIIAGCAGSDPNEEWTYIYKTILASPTLGLSEETANTLSSCEATPNSSINADGITVQMSRINNIMCLITFS